ncbi:MAG: DUF3119 family protein [Cyanobacteria bacterium K_DeepCast_35m_m1_288]|nr:DUF3119 family protein [Cyanobacteria bacterium K_DeepCast_35m_m1_288]
MTAAEAPLPDPSQGVILAPSHWLPLAVVGLGLASLLLNPWLSLVVSLFGLFLLIQSQILRLQFSADALLVWRGSTVLRRFPYSEWLSWTLFWSPIPVLFYFREQRSIHFLPVLFDPKTLREQLNLHVSAQP